MGASDKSGFTILETMLFLAITGLMVVAILVSTGSTVNIQRYRDSVTSLKSYLQGQYSDVMNVRNEQRTISLSCDSNAITSETAGVKNLRGQAECIILGRLIKIDDKDISSSTVLGYGSSLPDRNDIDDLKTYKMSTLSDSLESSQLEWGTRIAWPVSGPGSQSPTTPRSLTLLILRSPLSGLVYTFISKTSSVSLTDMVLAGGGIPEQGQASTRVCVDSTGLFDGGGMSVFINSYASGPSSIETRSNDMGDASKC